MSKQAKKTANRAAVQQTEPAQNPVAVVVQNAIGARAPLPAGIVITRRITMPSLVMKKAGVVAYLTIVDAMRVSTVKNKPVKDSDGKEKPLEPATVCTVGDILTGEMYTFLVPSVVRENLKRDYPNDTYVGKCFLIENKGKRNEGQRYWDFAIAEIDASGLTAAAQSGEGAAQS